MSLILRQDIEGLARLTINRTDKLNALNGDVLKQLRAHIRDIVSKTDDIGCVVLQGAGGCFSVGHDLNEISSSHVNSTFIKDSQTIEMLANLPQPVISAVQGYCYTGGLELALGGDIIIASASAKFADTHAKWALVPGWGMSQRLPRRVGVSKAKQMMFTGQTYSAGEALAMGLVDLCLPDNDFQSQVDAVARSILLNSWHSIRAMKKLINETDGMSLTVGLAHELYRCEWAGPDMAERVARFTGKKRR